MGESEALPPCHQGRRPVYTTWREVTAQTLPLVMAECGPTFFANRAEADYLLGYYRGRQPVLSREKAVRPEINNRVVENRAKEAVDFKVGYQLAECIQYVSRPGDSEGGDDVLARQMRELNALMYSEDKASQDRDLFEWMCIAGCGYRMVLPDPPAERRGAPFSMWVLDPRSTFVVRSADFAHRVLAGVCASVERERGEVWTVYTPQRVFEYAGGRVLSETGNPLGAVPVVEYPLNPSRMGVFEAALPLLDALNLLDSNRLDGVEQTVQSLMKFVNCDIDEKTFDAMMRKGAVKVTSADGVNGDVGFITNNLDQSQTQVLKDDLLKGIFNVCGVPNHAGAGASSSDTGAAVMLRDGWTQAEAHAKSYELAFKASEREFLRVALSICERAGAKAPSLDVRDVDLAFNRRNYENALAKSQILTTMLSSEWVHPQLAFQSSGLFCDPEAAYLQSKDWHDERAREAEERAAAVAAQAVEAPDEGEQADKAAEKTASPNRKGEEE